MAEVVLEPEVPIIDPHHHLWWVPDLGSDPARTPPIIARQPRYLFDELMVDLSSGHNIRATVFIECGTMYRADGPEHLKPVGETEFVNGVAAMGASGTFGPIRTCAAIVGHADLTIGESVDEVLEAHLAASRRFRGIRHYAGWDDDPIVNRFLSPNGAGLYNSTSFRRGFARLSKYGLSFDAWLLEPQLPDLIDLAKIFPEIPIILDHVGTPLNLGRYEGKREERFGIWRKNLRKLAELPNLSVKLGGLGMDYCNFPSYRADPPARSAQLAQEWKPYLETCVEMFGPNRCMFESNFPVDRATSDYTTLWNAYKIFAKGYSSDEKTQIFSETAIRTYRLREHV